MTWAETLMDEVMFESLVHVKWSHVRRPPSFALSQAMQTANLSENTDASGFIHCWQANVSSQLKGIYKKDRLFLDFLIGELDK